MYSENKLYHLCNKNIWSFHPAIDSIDSIIWLDDNNLFNIWCYPEVSKVTLKSNGKKVLSDKSL
jgi:hypothetical protein